MLIFSFFITASTAPLPKSHLLVGEKLFLPHVGCSPWLEMISFLRPRSDPEMQSTENWVAGREGGGLWGMCGAITLAVGLSLADILAIQYTQIKS